MNKKKKVMIGIILMILVIMVLISITYIPRRIVKIEPEEVSAVKIFNGSNGEEVILTDKEEVSHIINNLNKIKFQKSKLGFFYMGYAFRITIYDNNEKEYKEFVINSNSSIRYKLFFYVDKTKSIDFDYLNSLFAEIQAKQSH